MDLCAEVMALPANERLEYALDVIRELTGQKIEKRLWAQQKFGLSQKEAELFLAINARSPEVAAREALFSVIWSGADVDIKILDVYVCKLRAKGIKISTQWGVGYWMPEKIEVSEVLGSDALQAANQKQHWTPEMDADLIQMKKNGSTYKSMAYELDRTLRGVQERVHLLIKQKRL